MDAQVTFKKGEPITADQAMHFAIEVAKRGAPYVSPNPVVGCVVVDQNHCFLDFGFHPKFGQEHAEINALNKLSAVDIKNSTFYVTLEPCAHQGKTGSCAAKLAALSLKKVVYGIIDPNPLVKGKGLSILNEAGIETEEYSGVLKSELLQLSEIFLKNINQSKVFVAAKVASSLDGQIALKSGESKWITSEASRELVHELRSYYDAIFVGSNTVRQDDPSLNIRHPLIKKENLVVIFDYENEIYKDEFKFQKIHSKDRIYFVVAKVDNRNPYQQIEFLSLENLLKQLWELGIRSLFIEGGSQVYSSFLQAGLVDRLYLFIAPSIIGSLNGLSWTSQVNTESLSSKILFSDMKVSCVGSDVFMTARLKA